MQGKGWRGHSPAGVPHGSEEGSGLPGRVRFSSTEQHLPAGAARSWAAGGLAAPGLRCRLYPALCALGARPAPKRKWRQEGHVPGEE